VLALVCAAALLVTGVLAKLVPLTQQGDARTLHGFVGLNAPRVTPLLDRIAHLADPGPYALTALLLALVALARGRRRVALLIPLVFLLTGATAEVLKHLLASPRLDEWLGPVPRIDAASWPSGHATAAMTMALCAVLAAPPRLRPTVAVLGGAFAIAVGYAILALAWHLPSDVFGGYLLAGTYVLLALAALAWAQRVRPTAERAQAAARPVDVVPALGIALGAAGAAFGLALTRPHALLGYAEDHTTFVVGALTIAALALVLALTMAAGLRVGGPASTAAGWRPAARAAPRRRWHRG
jgi:membrane-associated phospholipid phosphatase